MNAHLPLVKKLAAVLSIEQGCRLGETAVVSRKVHTITSHKPDTVHVMRDADAGRVFYRRPKANEVLHVDVFHSLSEVSPQVVAKAACLAVERYGQQTHIDHRELAHFIDLQTAAGGGRATGRLTFGQRDTLKQAHQNHVHLTLLLAERDLALIFLLVEEVERALIETGVELRKIERVVHAHANAGLAQDLDSYRAASDSFLLPARPAKEGGEKADTYALQLAHLADLLEEMEDISELRHLLYTMHPAVNSRGVPMPASAAVSRLFQVRLAETWTKLKGYGYVEGKDERYLLSLSGMRLYESLAHSTRQLECDLKYYHRLGRQAALAAAKHGYGRVNNHRRAARGYQARPHRIEGERELALVPTISASLYDAFKAQRAWRVLEQHLHFQAKTARQRLDICLLIDASASMMGRRMKAAKELARQLVHATDDRLSVIYFQEDRVELAVPFTRNQILLKNGLRSIKPSGLTPLALGLLRASQYLSKHSCRERSLLIVITDGIPTMAMSAGDPMEEVLQQAKDIGKRRLNLCCVGLQPNQRLLCRIAEAAGGSVHVIDEITAPLLLSIVEQERRAALASRT
ncbi:MAG: VWA domain-containing protein [Selenomonadales bacterium]|nr:VWA domain-containing protein [Selenomonadales bacterium]